MFRSIKIAAAIALFLTGSTGITLFAQTNTGRIVGTVADDTGAVIPGVEVVVRNPATGLTRNVITNESGNYQVPLLPPSVYEVEASLAGFRREVRSGITLQVDAVLRVDFALKVGDTSEKIEVTADAPLLQSETAALGQVMDSRKVTDIPLNQRHFMMLTTLTTGVQPVVQGSNLSSQNLSFHANGARERDNNFLLDGVDNNDTGNGQLNIVPSIDAIQEFKISTTQFGAELGRAGGGVLNVQTKSGSNAFHLVLFEFLRNDIFDARNFFATSQPPYKRNQFGLVVSGPIKKDRMFYMLNYEGNRIRNTTTSLATVPTLRMLNGDFSEVSRQLIDPISRQPFPGNIIPAERIDRLGKALAGFYPAPNRGITTLAGNNYLANAKGLWDFDIYTGRVDYRVSEKQNVFARFTWQDSYQVKPSTGLPNYGTVYFQPIGRNAAISDTYVLGTRVVNEFRVGFNRLIGGLFGELYQQDYAKQLGITGVQSQVHPHGEPYTNFGLPSLSVTNFSGIGGSNHQLRFDNTWHWYDMMAVTRGNHQMKIGGDLRTMMLNIWIDGSSNGSFSFDGRYSGYALADMLLGYTSQTSRRVGDPFVQNRSRAVSLFFQDDWKVNQQLTLNMGVRWEVQTVPINRLKGPAGGLATFEPATAQIVIGGRRGPQTIPHPYLPGQTVTVAGGLDYGIPEGLFNNDLNDYAPRFGFAWSPKSRALVVRGGYGIFYEPDISAITHTFRDAAYPWNLPQTFIGDTTRPNVTLADPWPDALSQSSITAGAIEKDMRNGYVQQWNLGIQRPLGANMVVDVSYSGSAGIKLIGSHNINQAVRGSGTVASRRPYPNWGNISLTERSQQSNYNSMQSKFERRFAAGLTFVTAYTWSHSIDNAGSQDAYNRAADRGNSDWDYRHRLVNSYSWELPFGPGRRFLKNISGVGNALLGGWQLAGITTFSSGQKFSPSVSGDIAGIGATSVRPNRIADGVLPRGERGPSKWFDTSAFTIPATGTFGNAGRNILSGPGTNNWDLTLMKSGKIGEHHSMQFRAEFFNAFNHPNFMLPSSNVTSSSYGTITAAKDARQLQFGLKLFY